MFNKLLSQIDWFTLMINTDSTDNYTPNDNAHDNDDNDDNKNCT